MFQNQNSANGNGGVLGGATTNTMDPAQHQSMNYNGMQHQQPPQQHQQPQQQQQQHQHQQQQEAKSTKNVRQKPYVKITEQPAGKALRFRYECEGRSAGSIPGVNSTPENKTYPTIEIVGYKGRAVVVVSCVTKDQPYRPHPHNLVGKEGCKKGVCTLEINSETMRAVFSNLGIQCVKKKDIEAALKAREEIRVDPFKTGFSHRYQPSSIDLNSVRLCFQVFMESDQKGRFTQPLPPVVSDPIFDKKAMSDLVICRLCSCSASVLGNTQIILLCEKVAKEDIAVRFFEEKNGQVVWEAYGEFQHTDVHKQTAITFKTPRYHTLDRTEPAKVFIQLKRPSDGVTSEKLPFEYKPLDSGRHTLWSLRRNLKRKPDEDLFQQILAVDQQQSELSLEPVDNTAIEVIDLDTPTQEQPAIVALPSDNATRQAVENNETLKSNEQEIDLIINEKVRQLEQQDKQQESAESNLAMSMEEGGAAGEDLTEPQQLTANDKINEWMKSNEVVQMETASNQQETSEIIPFSPNTSDDDKTLNALLEQVAELDEIYSDHVVRRDTYNNTILNELKGMDACEPAATPFADGGQTEMELDENFDDAATYTSLQIAFKNPVSIPVEDLMPPTPPGSQCAAEDAQHYDHVEVNTQQNTSHSNLSEQVLNVVNAPVEHDEPPPRPAPPKVASPHMHVTAAEEEKLPPLPPKRLRKQDSDAENRSSEANSCSTLERKPRTTAPIIIMKTPDQSPPTKRLPPKPGSSNSNSNTLPKQKKPGFFSKLFSRRKSKSDLSQQSNSKNATPSGSREPSIAQFQMNESTRNSIRSAKSLQPIAANSSPEKSNAKTKIAKQGKPVGRSVSSVSGKRPTYLDADVIHIPLKGDSASSLPHNEAYSNASTITLGNALDRRTASALQLAEIPISDGNMELVAITDRQSLRNLCEGEFNVLLDPNVDLTEAEHFALYTSIPPQATVSEFDETSAYYAPVDAGEILTPEEVAQRLAAANRLN